MFRHTLMATALAIAFGVPHCAFAAGDKDLAQIREQIKQMKDDYETRIQALEKRLQQAEAKPEQPAAAVAVAAPPPPLPAPAPASSNAFNPSIALILGGTYANLSQDPSQYRIQGFIPGGDGVGPGKRGLNLGESELTLSANIDPQFAGQLTFSLTGENTVSVEESFLQTQGLSNGLNLKAGRFLSAVGYLNSQHAHAWDFVDAPLAYQAFFGGQYKVDGVEAKWLAPTERFFELGLEAGSGAAFPGNDRNRNGIGASALFAHVGDDIGDSASWRTGLSYLRSSAANRAYADGDSINAFSGHSDTWIADAIYKWSPNGNPTYTNFKLQGEYFRRNENGTLSSQAQDTVTGGYASAQSGWYLQGVYQFMPSWRAGLRYDRLDSGTPNIGLVDSAIRTAADFAQLASYHPSRSSLMLDYTPSEFSRFRLQFARDMTRPGAVDNQVFLQYIMSLGTHGAHTF